MDSRPRPLRPPSAADSVRSRQDRNWTEKPLASATDICPERRREQDIAEAGETPRSFAENDPFGLDSQLSEDQNLVRGNARGRRISASPRGRGLSRRAFRSRDHDADGPRWAASGDSARLSTPRPRAASHSNIPGPLIAPCFVNKIPGRRAAALNHAMNKIPRSCFPSVAFW